MDGTNPKVSFIPKGSLVREEPFLERRRPQSAIGFLAAFVFFLSVGSYAGLYYYNDSLNKIVAQKTIEIKKAQKEFSDAPEVSEAKVFRARADLARTLLDSHTVTSPVFAFLSQNTTESILYDKFSFKNSSAGSALELTGEAPSYASLAYQADVLRGKTTELASFSVGDIALTKFGTVTFKFSMIFNPSYLLYASSMNGLGGGAPEQPVEPLPLLAPTPNTIPVSASTSSVAAGDQFVPPPTLDTPLPASEASSTQATDSLGGASAPSSTPVTPSSPSGLQKQSFLMTLWSKFKFW